MPTFSSGSWTGRLMPSYEACHWASDGWLCGIPSRPFEVALQSTRMKAVSVEVYAWSRRVLTPIRRRMAS